MWPKPPWPERQSERWRRAPLTWTCCVIDAGVAGPPLAGARLARPVDPPGDLVTRDGLSAADAERLVAAGAALPVGAGLTAVGEVGVGNTTVAAALAAGLLGGDPNSLIGLGAGSDSATVEAKRAVVSAALARVRGGGQGSHPMALLAALGGGEFAVLAGVILGVATRGGVVVLDGLATSVAALVAVGAGAGGGRPSDRRPAQPRGRTSSRAGGPRPRAGPRPEAARRRRRRGRHGGHRAASGGAHSHRGRPGPLAGWRGAGRDPFGACPPAPERPGRESPSPLEP